MTDEIRERIEQIKRGENPEGYIRRYKYIYPTTWNLYKMGGITTKISKKNKQLQELPAYSINNQTGFVPQDEQFEEGSYTDLDKSSYKVVSKGQFAYNPARINVGSLGLLKDAERVIVSSLYVCFSLNKGFLNTYFENWFKTYDFDKEVVRNLEGSVREYLFYENFSKIYIPAPSISEQRKIAEILTQCDKVISLKKERIEEEKKQKKWLLQKLLDPDSGVRLPGFSGEWSKRTLRQCCTSSGVYGLNAPSCSYKEGLPHYIRITDIDDNGKYVKSSEAYVDSAEVSKYYLLKGDLLFVRTGATVGKAYRYREEDGLLVYAGFLIKFSVDLSTYDDYLIYSLFSSDFYYKWVQRMSARSGQPGINADEYSGFTFEVPLLKEQNAIAKVLFAQDYNIELLEQELEQWQQKKKSLMQLLLTGIVRVTV